MKKNSKNQKSPFQSILVGVDFSNYSKLVFKQAQSLADELGAQLVTVYADFPEWQVAGPEVMVPIPKPDPEEVADSLRKFYQIKPSSSVIIEVGHGYPTETVLAVAKKYPTPLIVVGSQGKNAVSRFILGSHAENIALHSPYPVWIQRGRKVVPLKKVLIPTDLSENSKKQIQTLQEWSQNWPLSLKYLFVKPEALPLLQYPAYREMSQEIQKEVKSTLNQFKQKGPQVPLVTVTGNNPSQEISRLGKDYDVIAMNPHSHRGILHRFGHVTSKVVRLADNPVLVLRS